MDPLDSLTRHLRVSDLRGVAQLSRDATVGITDVVEHMQRNIWREVDRSGGGIADTTVAATGVVFGTIRGLTRLVVGGFDALLGFVVTDDGTEASSVEREGVIAALNGVVGEHLAASGNPLAIVPVLRRAGRTLVLERSALEHTLTDPTGKILLLVHGLCMNDLQWRRNGRDHGSAMAEAGWTPVFLHYNSGLHVSENGRILAGLLDDLVSAWPVPVQELAILGHSMGGLVARSACHYSKAAEHRWLERLRRILFLGTPHHGAPLERGGSWIDAILQSSPYTAAIARLGKIRSAGITDLRHGNLLDDDWKNRDRFARSSDGHRPVPLPEGVACFAIAASLSGAPAHIGKRALGDGLVPLDSALGKHAKPELDLGIPERRQWTGHGLNHLDLLDHPEVIQRVRRWLA